VSKNCTKTEKRIQTQTIAVVDE